MEITIPDAANQMLQIVEQLQSAYPKKRFTLEKIGDGFTLAVIHHTSGECVPEKRGQATFPIMCEGS